MADGSSGNLGGILFEAGKAVGNTVKGHVQQAGNSVVGQLGAQKPLFGGTQKQPASGAFTPTPAGGQMPKVDPFGDFGKMFEGGKPGFGAKKSPQPQAQQQFSQADLDAMAAQNRAVDDQEIAKRQAELEQIKMQKHKQLHNEVYYNDIKNVGQHSIAQERKQKAEEDQQEEETRRQQQQAQGGQLPELSGSMMGNNPQLGAPVAVTQAKTQTETNRGTTG